VQSSGVREDVSGVESYSKVLLLRSSCESVEVEMTIANSVRWQVLKRDNFTCQYCGASAPDVKLHVDHVQPKFKGGGDYSANLRTACEQCNSGKRIDELPTMLLPELGGLLIAVGKACEPFGRQELIWYIGQLFDSYHTTPEQRLAPKYQRKQMTRRALFPLTGLKA